MLHLVKISDRLGWHGINVNFFMSFPFGGLVEENISTRNFEKWEMEDT
jgi:hypothetical protein